MLEIIKNGEVYYLVDKALVEQAKSVRTEINSFFEELSEIVELFGLSRKEEDLRGLFNEGVIYLEERIKRELMTWIKKSPLASSSVSRLLEEKVEEEISSELRRRLDLWREAYNELKLDIVPLPEEIVYEKGKLFLVEEYEKRAESFYSYEFKAEDMNLAHSLKQIVLKLTEIRNKGFQVLGFLTSSYDGQLYHVDGLIDIIMRNPESVTEESILLAMCNNRRKSFEALHRDNGLC